MNLKENFNQKILNINNIDEGLANGSRGIIIEFSESNNPIVQFLNGKILEIKKKDYKPYIDGLRALAVLPVIFFHADFKFFDGGFVGVDIFFVISGYLITNIIIQDLYKKKFSLIGTIDQYFWDGKKKNQIIIKDILI